MSQEASDLRLRASISGLAGREPVVSAQRILSRGQRTLGLTLIGLFVVGCLIDLILTVTVIVAVVTVIYVAAIIYRLVLFRASSKPGTTEVVSDEDARDSGLGASGVYGDDSGLP